MPTTPAAKAAALTRHATGGEDESDGVTLAEEGPRSRRGTAMRVAALVLVTAVVIAGGSYAAYAWSQQRYYLAAQDGLVTVFRGVDQTLGPVSLSSAAFSTAIAVDDLPPSYQESIENGIQVDDRAAAEERVDDLRLQAQACRWARLQGETCHTVPRTWTPPTVTPTPSATSPTPSASASPAPSGSPSPVTS